MPAIDCPAFYQRNLILGLARSNPHRTLEGYCMFASRVRLEGKADAEPRGASVHGGLPVFTSLLFTHLLCIALRLVNVQDLNANCFARAAWPPSIRLGNGNCQRRNSSDLTRSDKLEKGMCRTGGKVVLSKKPDGVPALVHRVATVRQRSIGE